MNRLPGIAGTLFPSHYLAEAIEQDAPKVPADHLASRQRHLSRWWEVVSATCGPATGLRALFDLVAMPLFGMLGFRAHDAVFDRRQATAWLSTRQGTPVGLVLLPWAERPSARWRDLTSAARDVGADWAFLLAPPFLTLIDARGHATRRDVEFTLPDVLETPSFARVWWLARAEAFDRPPQSAAHAMSWIDHLVERAVGFQDRVREDLQHGVAEALAALSGAIATAVHRRPVAAQSRRPAPGPVSPTSFDEALTIVYRILFLLFAESRDLVPVRAPIYAGAYAVGTLGREARADATTPGLWEALAAVTRLSRVGCRTDDLIVRPFNGRLFSRASAPSLEMARTRGPRSASANALDAAAQRALLALGSRTGPGGLEAINYADLGVEQLGSVYERVLDLDVPRPAGLHVSAPSVRGSPRGQARHSTRRKQTGTFYTPRALAEFVVRRTLAPLVAGVPADAILRLRVLDPAMGSGAFLVASCRFLAAAYERALIDEGRLAPAELDEHERADIRRRIAEQCLAGVDVNPVAVQLARLSLWLATLAHGKPLTFLDHRLRVGNSLVGASPADLDRTPGRRRSGAPTALPLFDDGLLEHSMRRAALPLSTIASRRDENVSDVRAKEALWNQLISDHSPLHAWRLAATLWCARWFWPGDEVAPGPAELRALLDAVLRADGTLPAGRVAGRVRRAGEIGSRHAFFHWPLEFPDVFYDGDGRLLARPGFDAILGNPPWEMLRHGPDDHGDRGVEDRASLVRFVRESGVFPSCDRGHLNLYQPFLDRSLSLTRQGGRLGLVLPWGLAADDGAVLLRERLLEDSAVDTLVGLDNAGGLFPIHRGLRFLVLTTTPGGPTHEIRGRFGLKTVAELDALPARVDVADDDPFPIRLTPRLIRSVGGPAARFPDIRHADDLQRLVRLTARFPPLGRADGWAVSFGRELNATEHRTHFGRHGLPVIEGKHLSPFRTDIGAATSFVDRASAEQLFRDVRFDQPRLGYRDVSGVGNRVSLIAAIVPAGALTTHTIFCLRSRLPLLMQHFLCGLFNSYVLNAVVRLLMGGHLTTTLVEGLPVPVWRTDARQRRIARLAARLAGTSEHPRVNARLQAEVAHLYGLDARDFDRVLEGFPLVPDADRQLANRMFQTRSGRDQDGGADLQVGPAPPTC